MPVETKYYDLLGVDPKAEVDKIKSSFRKLALKYHPDKNRGDDAATEKFKEIQHAAEVLLDSEKRAVYDRYGERGLEAGMGRGGAGGAGGSDFSNIFDLFTGGSGGGGGAGGAGAGASSATAHRKGRDFTHDQYVSLEDMYIGKTIRLSMSKKVVCGGCQGCGASSPSKAVRCGNCDGTGVQTVMHRMGPFIQQSRTKCTECNGDGTIVKDKDRCAECRGRKIVDTKKIHEVLVTPGMHSGTRVVLREEADQMPGVTPGDVVLTIKQRPNSVFSREPGSDDLHVRVKIDLVAALCGHSVVVKLPNNEILNVPVAAGEILQAPDTVVRVPHYGFKRPEALEAGNLVIAFTVVHPPLDVLAKPETQRLLRAALPAPRPCHSHPGLSKAELDAAIAPHDAVACSAKAARSGAGAGASAGARQGHQHAPHRHADTEDDYDDDDEYDGGAGGGGGNFHAHARGGQQQVNCNAQ